ncbi:serine/threonine protein kinase [Rummeliibacillus sp. G93]|uniref:serine/threonine protein kinase n=1 Tax=Rummeliibacillus sp. G93 TaxID=2939494 RepID=UPI00201C0FD5|nr:serine/threonine protein kinase [Rummeliibacillus sp. G93]UQW96676.1 serine/threonine protein kinase [Rummeliibacillus sp. G93]
MSLVEFREEQFPLWEAMLKELFENDVPFYKEWSTLNDIKNVLNFIGEHRALNHTFMPEGGGEDLLSCTLSNEPNCIDMILGGIIHRVKPKKLTFHWFKDAEYQWGYFMLDTDQLEPTGIYDNVPFKFEEVVEVTNLHYIPRHHWDSGEYNGRDLPSSSRLVIRFISGKFAIFSKASTYNANSSTYDGRHDKFSVEEFANYIERNASNN